MAKVTLEKTYQNKVCDVELGQFFTKNGSIYIVCSGVDFSYVLINIETGRKWAEPKSKTSLITEINRERFKRLKVKEVILKVEE